MPKRARTRAFSRDERAKVGRRAGAGVVDQVGVIVGHVNIAARHALGPHLFQKPGGRHFAVAHRGWRALAPPPSAGRSFSSRFLKMLPAHFMVAGNFSLRTFRISSAVWRRAAASPASSRKSTEKMTQSLWRLKTLSRYWNWQSALPKSRTCGRRKSGRRSRARRWNGRRRRHCRKRRRPPNRGCPPASPGPPVRASMAKSTRSCERRAGVGRHPRPAAAQTVAAVAQHDAAKAAVGHNQVRAAADHHASATARAAAASAATNASALPVSA